MTTKTKPAARRRHGEGSIGYDEKRGLYIAQITVDGTRRTVSSKSEKACVDKLATLRADMKRGAAITRRVGLTMSDVFDHWLTYSLPNDPRVKAPGTRIMHRDNAARWKGLIGSRPAATLSVDDVERGYRAIANGSDKRADGRPRRPAGVAHMNRMGDTLRKAVADGVRRGVLNESVGRVVSTAQVPKTMGTAKAERRALTSPEMRALVAASTHHRLHAMFVLALSTGLRPGEVSGLYWSDLNLDAAVPYVEINHAAQRQANGRYVVGDVLKNAGAYRSVELTPMVVDALRRHRKIQTAERLAATSWANPDLVFASARGTVLNPSNVRREYDQLCAKAGVARIVPYETRHSFATMLAESSLNTFAIVDILGHVDDRMLSRTYRKKRKGIVAGSTAVVDQFLGSAK